MKRKRGDEQRSRLKDIPSMRALQNDARNVALLKRVYPFARPLLKTIGVDVTKMADAVAQVDDFVRQAEELIGMPDRFNDLFAAKGWIMYRLMNFDVAKMAVEKAEAGDFGGAEAVLVDYYDAETVRWKLNSMTAVRAFRPRLRLAHKALIDYAEGRYHACVPVVLALMDGLVNDLHPKHRGLFSDGAELEAWDSIAAHSRGLGILVPLFQKGRYKTSIEEISVPYRNGIMHGMDLGYDNKLVAAKAWAALFAIREWALKVEGNETAPPPQRSQTTWSALGEQVRETEQKKRRLLKWEPRKLQAGVDLPETGESNEFVCGSPEQKLAHFLNCWIRRNYGDMAKCLLRAFRDKKAPSTIREMYSTQTLTCFRFVSITDDAAAKTTILVHLVVQESGQTSEKDKAFVLINEDEQGTPSVRGQEGTEWAIQNYGIWA